MVAIDLTFPHSYAVEEPPELSGTGDDVRPIYIPTPESRTEHDGVWVKISRPGGGSWVGVFAFGYTSPPAISRIISLPDPDRVCIVSRGAAYLVEASQPEVWERLPVMPVIDVVVVPAQELVVFANFTRLSAYNRNGLAWQSPRLCWDGLKIDAITHSSIECRGYDPTAASGESFFAVDLLTGHPRETVADRPSFWKRRR